MMDRLIELLGWEATERLVLYYGAARLYVPTRGASADVRRVLGDEASEALHREFAGERIDVPSHAALVRRSAVRYATGQLRRGAPIRRVAAETGLSRRHVARLAQVEIDDLDRSG